MIMMMMKKACKGIHYTCSIALDSLGVWKSVSSRVFWGGPLV